MPSDRERIQQLETLATEQGQAIESVARGLANLTVDVQQGFARVNQEFAQVHQEFAQVNTRLDKLETNVTELKTDVAILKTDVAGIKSDVSGLKTGQKQVQQTLDMLLAYLRERL
ncbi:DUF2730 family protein [Larkinella sp. VNQ87]|uniref:DUF2730 family protein n=1 Tax=Larkinella sp. VNQ87 TaxID=3400921 RepID=UPI003C05148B